MTQLSPIRTFWIAACCLLAGCGLSLPEEVETAYAQLPETIDFNFHVRPILSDRCFPCHGPDEKSRKADLRLDVEEQILAKTAEGETFPVVPGVPGKSAVIGRILHHDPEVVMPPPDSKLALTDVEKATLIKWIEQGAQWKKHWAFIPPQKSALPEVRERSWPRNEVDYFVLSKLESQGLDPSSEAEKETLIRRVSFDLTGLPPTLAEIEDFTADEAENAYEKLVDRLLASPRYGERWTWEWLDVARYADTDGFQGDPTRTMWPWRDWIIQAFNDNMPYDEFTVKQLAGDLLAAPAGQDILATAFNRNHTYNGEGGRIPEETRVENVFDRVETVGTAWLGLTLNCCRCHDHKFDAITQKEYYQLFDYFNQTSEEGKTGSGGRVPPLLNLSPVEDKQEVEKLKAYVQKVADRVEKAELTQFPRAPGLPASQSPKADEVTGKNFNALASAPVNRNPYQLNALYTYFESRDASYAGLLKQLITSKENLQAQVSKSIQVMVMDQMDTARATFVLERGTYSKPLEQVSMNVPAVLPSLPPGAEPNRLALAKWLVAKENPLTARVTVNRYWQAFFGNGIVRTIEDFGVQGALPVHPELLDWLAVDFQENGWNLKALFKKIVMSATYRQSSIVSEEMLKTDPENRYLARATRLRLPAWMIRDQALYISGLMVDDLGGAPVKPYQPPGIWEEATFGKIKYQQDHGDALYRRTLYTFWRRIVGPTNLFDNASRRICSVKALHTNTPMHALTTLNDVSYMEAARVLAERVLITENTDKDRLAYAFELATARKPVAAEFDILENRLTQLRSEYAAAPEEAKKITSAGECRRNETLDLIDLASYTVLSSLILNLDETITRQ